LTFDDGSGAVTEAILDEGHEFGAHGWRHVDHRHRPLARAREVAGTADQIGEVTGVRPRLFRPPYGHTNHRLQIAVALRGFRTVLWDVDPHDFDEPGAAVIADRVLAAIRPGSIVLKRASRPRSSSRLGPAHWLARCLRGSGTRGDEQLAGALEATGRLVP
jgi:peptidoglycan/xylan/chitin deacetylase (PgdA/CDA1 family)